ncbi:MAG TPA: hypothetical protein VK934_01720 [Fimbriimonas sp.]|nr:hypothetical protein [Fimbriimonas sp.]
MAVAVLAAMLALGISQLSAAGGAPHKSQDGYSPGIPMGSHVLEVRLWRNAAASQALAESLKAAQSKGRLKLPPDVALSLKNLDGSLDSLQKVKVGLGGGGSPGGSAVRCICVYSEDGAIIYLNRSCPYPGHSSGSF